MLKIDLSGVNFRELKLLRKKIHAHPCVSGNEGETAQLITEYLQKLNPINIYTGIGGCGVIAEFALPVSDSIALQETDNKGNILLRAELDALPIGHKCGHDGHMIILCGVAQWLSKLQKESVAFKDIKASDKTDFRSVYLLFQPEEEIGTGAKKMVEDIEIFNRLHPEQKIDYQWAFALHNWPGFKENCVIIFPNCYAWGSTGMKISFKGVPAHASEPENSSRIGELVSNFVLAVASLNKEDAFSTCIGIKVGEENFGTAPADGCVCLTVRGANEEALNSLIEQIKIAAEMVVANFSETNQMNAGVAKNKIETEIVFCDRFPVTINHRDANIVVEKVAKDLNLEIIKNEIGDRGSDDFSYLANGKKSSFFNLGAGENLPPIHSTEFDFNDNLLKTGITLFCGILNEIL